MNGGKCGVCGDPYYGRRDNELPNGKYAQNLVITRTYNEANIIDLKVSLTANHRGFFVFKICPANNYNREVTQDCLDQFPLTIINSKYSNKYIVPTKRAETFAIKAKLPDGLTCDRCVLQWTYTAGNNWGRCEDGKSVGLGCGPQEMFRGCADVTIVGQYSSTKINSQTETPFTRPVSSTNNSTDSPISWTVTKPHTKLPDYPIKSVSKIRPSLRPVLKPNDNEIEDGKKCRSDGLWRGVPNMDQWCRTNCAVGYCPPSHCTCS